MLVPFPIALWIFSLCADVIFLAGWGGPAWNNAAIYTMAGGIIGALLAAPFGLIDLLSVSDPRAKNIGKAHMVMNLVLVALFAINLWLRVTGTAVAGWPIILSVFGILLLGLSGWLGGEMVYVHGVAVQPRTPGDERMEKERLERSRRMTG